MPHHLSLAVSEHDDSLARGHWFRRLRRVTRVLFAAHRTSAAEIARLTAEVDRLTADLELVWTELRRRSDRTVTVDETYTRFMERFRGSSDVIRTHLERYVPLLHANPPVVDLGCGRGELLEMLRHANIEARGVDINPQLVQDCVLKDLDVVQGEALRYVSDLAPDSVGAISMMQLLEHLDADEVTRLLDSAFKSLRSGGLLLAETVNVTSWCGFSSGYLRDYTHRTWLHPETLAHLVGCAGFQDVAIEYLSHVSPADGLQSIDAADDVSAHVRATFNRNVELLNSRVFGYQDYVITARRP